MTPNPVPKAVRLLTAISLFWRRSKRDIRNYLYCDAPLRLWPYCKMAYKSPPSLGHASTESELIYAFKGGTATAADQRAAIPAS